MQTNCQTVSHPGRSLGMMRLTRFGDRTSGRKWPGHRRPSCRTSSVAGP